MSVILEACRPRQWIKNLLVAAAPLAGGTLFEKTVLVDVALVFASFCAAASSMYIFNDLRDRKADSVHRRKHLRPIASGRLAPRAAGLASLVLVFVGITLASMVSLTTLTVVSAYLLSTAMYSVFLKRIPFIELLVLASGFVLRAIAGAYASDVVPSMWFLGCILCGSLFVALRKRYTEFQMGNSVLVSTRFVLTKYSESMLRIMSQIAASVFVFTYTGWAVATTNEITQQSVLRIASVVPFAAAVVWYERKTTQERGEAPEDIFINDRLLQILGLLWFGLVGASIYLVG